MSIVLAPYNPDWPRAAAGHADRLRVLGPVLIAVHHIGSTAVPGLAAKPTIDLMPLVASLAELDRVRTRIEGLGYEWRGEFGIAGRRYCTLSDDAGTRLVNAHFFARDSREAQRHIVFRDYLRAHPDAVATYEAEKRRARNPHPNDVHAYSDEKDAWIRAAEAKAFAWFAAQEDCRK